MKTTSQKALKVLSIVVIVIAVLGTILGIAACYLGGTFMLGGVEIMNQLGESVETDIMAGGGLIAFMLGVLLIISGIIDITIGILGLGVAKDGRRIKLYIGLCIAGLFFIAVNIISLIASEMFDLTSLISPIVIGLALYFALDIKKNVLNQ